MKALKKIVTIVTKVELSISAVTFAVMVICYFINKCHTCFCQVYKCNVCCTAGNFFINICFSGTCEG